MRKIQFIAPIAAISGNLSGNQVLTYADHNNPAFDAPTGKQFANNYTPRFIGAQRAKDGRCYFAVKTKSATTISAASLLRMALLGGAAAWFDACRKNMAVYPAMQTALHNEIERGFVAKDTSLRKYAMDKLRDALSRKAVTVVFGTVAVVNPWYYIASGHTVPGTETPVSKEILIKFWLQLGCNESGKSPIYINVGGLKGIAFVNGMFGDIIGNSKLNVLGLYDVQDSVLEEGLIAISSTGDQSESAVYRRILWENEIVKMNYTVNAAAVGAYTIGDVVTIA